MLPIIALIHNFVFVFSFLEFSLFFIWIIVFDEKSGYYVKISALPPPFLFHHSVSLSPAQMRSKSDYTMRIDFIFS